MIVTGTSGYYFRDWSGSFYPADLPKDKWLEYYARNFPAVEINTTYYGLPRPGTVENWDRQTPDNFEFIVKLHQDSTHLRHGQGKEIAELIQLLDPLIRSSKLAGLLAQFPASFHFGDEECEYLAQVSRKVEKVRLFAEFRHISWDTDHSVSFCEELGLGWVAVDQPRIRGLAGARPAVSGNRGYVRFHGRNARTWYNREAGDRYDWDYSDAELIQWIPRLSAMAHRAEKTYLFFNNCHAGQAIRSAMRMKQLLRDQFEVL